jgi:hypothetical protein
MKKYRWNNINVHMNSYAYSICCHFIPILNLISSNILRFNRQRNKNQRIKQKAENENNNRWSNITRMNSDVDSIYLFLFLIKNGFQFYKNFIQIKIIHIKYKRTQI